MGFFFYHSQPLLCSSFPMDKLLTGIDTFQVAEHGKEAN